MFSTAYAFLKRDFLIAISYKSAFAAEIVGVLFKVITFYYIGKVFGSAVSPSLAAFGNNYFAFLILGIALMDFMHTSLATFDTSIRESQMMGTLEIILLSPIKLSRMLLYSSLWAYTFTTFRLLCYLFFGALLFDLDIGNGDPLTVIVFLALSVLCFAPLGIISAAVIVVFKKGMWFQTLVSAASFFLGGVAFPINVLPEWIRPFGFYVPMTHSVNGLRHGLLNGQSLAELFGEALFLLIFALVVTPISVFIFKLAISQAKVKGTLTHY